MQRQSTTSSGTGAWTLPCVCGGLYLFLCGVVFVLIKRRLGGHFGFTLDDPYIHLALAEKLAHGHYGINATEFSSPSSSILWPFLLIPFAGTWFHPYLALVWNLLFGLLAAVLIGSVIRRWPPQADAQGRMAFWKQALTGLLLIFAGNLIGLTFLGMEHVLQVLLAVCCAIGMMEALEGRAIPRFCLAAGVIAPMVRYEDLTLTVALCCALVGLRRWKTAAGVLAFSLAPLLGFAGYLRHLGLPMLPMSVLVKGNAYAWGSFGSRLVRQLRTTLHEALTNPEYLPLLVLSVLFISLMWTAPSRLRRFVFLGTALVGVLQLLFGRFGWFYRYEVYAVIFLTLLCMRVLSEGPQFSFGYFSLGLLFCAAPYIRAAALSPSVAEEVYAQQYQMHRFVDGFYHGDYAVNDLGLTSFQRTREAYVLDLFGLASYEAAMEPYKSASWLDGTVRRHNVDLAIVYPESFPEIPKGWLAVAQMCHTKEQIVVSRCVVFYSTTAEAAPAIRAELKSFAGTTPKEVQFIFDPPPMTAPLLPNL